MNLNLVAVCIAISMITGCAPGPKKAKYTVDQYLADRSLMNRTVEECANNPGDLRDDPDCVNAGIAYSQDGLGSLRDLPPIFGESEKASKPKTSSAH